MPKPSMALCNAPRMTSWPTAAGAVKLIRMKKRSVERSQYWALSAMLPPIAAIEVVTRATMPGRSVQDRLRIWLRSSSPAGAVRAVSAAIMRPASPQVRRHLAAVLLQVAEIGNAVLPRMVPFRRESAPPNATRPCSAGTAPVEPRSSIAGTADRWTTDRPGADRLDGWPRDPGSSALTMDPKWNSHSISKE